MYNLLRIYFLILLLTKTCQEYVRQDNFSLNSPSHISIPTSSQTLHIENQSFLVQLDISPSIYIPGINHQPHLNSSNFNENHYSPTQPNISTQNTTQGHVSPISVSEESSSSIAMHEQAVSTSSTPQDAFDSEISHLKIKPPHPYLPSIP